MKFKTQLPSYSRAMPRLRSVGFWSVIVRRRAHPRYFPYRPFLTAGRFTAESRPGDEIEDYLSLGGLPRVVRTLWPTFLNPESDVCWEVSSNQGISDSPRLKLRLPKINQTQM
jgi:hypothetical protein